MSRDTERTFNEERQLGQKVLEGRDQLRQSSLSRCLLLSLEPSLLFLAPPPSRNPSPTQNDPSRCREGGRCLDVCGHLGGRKQRWVNYPSLRMGGSESGLARVEVAEKIKELMGGERESVLLF